MALPLSRYVYGTTRLGDESIPFDDRVAIAREAIGRGLYLHTSHQYGDALKVLRAALDADRSAVPPITYKIGWSSVEEVRGQIKTHLDALGLERMAVGQLCPGGELAEELATGGPAVDGLLALKEEGLVGEFVIESWPWTSEALLGTLRGGSADRLGAGFIFYLNPLQRFVLDELWNELRSRGTTIVAMRTVAGGTASPSGPEYLVIRAAEMRPIFARSGIESWTEFCVRYALGYDQVVATVGSTARPSALGEFVAAAEGATPLDPEIVGEIEALHRQWSEEHDRFAAPWSM